MYPCTHDFTPNKPTTSRAKMSSGRSRTRARGSGRTMQLPGHVQNALNKEDRLLQQTLNDLKAETDYKVKSISQDQQVATRKLFIMEKRLSISQARSASIMGRTQERASARLTRPSTSSSQYYKALLAPTIRLQEREKQDNSELQTPPQSGKRKKSVVFANK